MSVLTLWLPSSVLCLTPCLQAFLPFLSPSLSKSSLSMSPQCSEQADRVDMCNSPGPLQLPTGWRLFKCHGEAQPLPHGGSTEGVRAGRCHTEKLGIFYHRTAAGHKARGRVRGCGSRLCSSRCPWYCGAINCPTPLSSLGGTKLTAPTWHLVLGDKKQRHPHVYLCLGQSSECLLKKNSRLWLQQHKVGTELSGYTSALL